MLLKNFSILYVEDNDDMQNYLKSFLEDEVKEFYQAFDGKMGQDIYINKRPDIILTDINMPVMDGLEMAKLIKEVDNHQPILILSAFQDVKTLKRAINIGVDGFIAKPIDDIEKLLDTLENMALNLQNYLDAKNFEKADKEAKILECLNLNLNKKVKEKTKELEKINATLVKQVEIEVEKNREKDKQLLIQSRLAQMGEMISMIAHQWRQPISTIGASIINIQMKLELEKYDLDIKEQRDDFLNILKLKLDKISQIIQDLSSTITDFRNCFKPNKEKDKVRLTTPIKRALDMLEVIMNSKSIKITTDYQTDDFILIYQNEVMQVILNIIKNSEDNFGIKSMDNKIVNIITKKIEGNYIIEISDNGGGIPKDIIDNIFDPYFTTKSEKNGSGLGLYMSKTIIEDHCNGVLTVENIDNGVKFIINFKQ